MTTDTLQRLLSVGLFSVDGEDGRLEKIRAAATELSGELGKDPALFLDAIFTSTDPAAASERSSMAAAATALSHHWNSYTNLSPSPPIGIFRAMTAQCVLSAADAKTETANGVTLLLRNILPRRTLHKETPFWTEERDKLEEAFEKRAAELWADNFNGPTGAVPKRPAEKSGKVDRPKLELAMLGAAGPHGPEGKAGTTPNPHWPSGNDQWALEYSKRAAKGVADAVEEAVAMALTGRGAIDKLIFETLEQRLPNAEGVQRRSRLLWFKEAGYSPVLARGYHEISPQIIPAVAAIDMYNMVLDIAPRSVEYFLRNTVSALAGSQSQNLQSALTAAAEANDRDAMGSLYPPGNRDLLSDAFGGAIGAGNPAVTGLFRADESLTPGDVSVILLREMLALSNLGVDA